MNKITTENNQRLICIGGCKKGGFEYGDFFHLASAIIVDQNVECIFVNDPNKNHSLQNTLFEFISKFQEQEVKTINLEEYKKRKEKGELNRDNNIGKTADIFLSKYDEREKISDDIKLVFKEKINENLGKKDKREINEYIKKFEHLKKNKNKKCFLWIRNGKNKPERNISSWAIKQLESLLLDCNITPILIGNSIGSFKENSDNLIGYHNNDPFKSNIFDQLYFLEKLIDQYDIKFSIGMKSGGMDSLALAFKFPSFYFSTYDSNGRMNKVSLVFDALKHIGLDGNKYDKFISFSDNDLRRTLKMLDQFLSK